MAGNLKPAGTDIHEGKVQNIEHRMSAERGRFVALLFRLTSHLAMYFIRRLILAIPLLLVISFLAFRLMKLAPGSPFDKERKPASPEIERNLLRKYHVDEPFWKQYLRYLGVGYEHDAAGKIHWFEGGLIRGDFGPSQQYRNHSVNDIIAQGLPVSLPLGLMAFGFAMGVGMPTGFFTAVKQGKWEDHAGKFSGHSGGLHSRFGDGADIGGHVCDTLSVVSGGPVGIALARGPADDRAGLYFAGRIARLMREGMLNVMQSEFITAARAKGMSETTLLLKHAVRIAILPVVSYSGPMLADLLTGSFVIESIFQIPGLGTPFVNSSLNRDLPLVVGLVHLVRGAAAGVESVGGPRLPDAGPEGEV